MKLYQAVLVKQLDACAKELSPTEKASGIGMAGVLLLATTQRAGLTTGIHFVSVESALGSWSRNPAEQLYYNLREILDPKEPQEIPSPFMLFILVLQALVDPSVGPRSEREPIIVNVSPMGPYTLWPHVPLCAPACGLT